MLPRRLRDWLDRFLLPGPDPLGPITLTQRRIYILPTRSGLLYALVLVVMLLGAINYSLSLGHALVFLLAALGLVAMLHTFANLVGLQIQGGTAEPVFAGEPLQFTLALDNPASRPRHALRLKFSSLPDARAVSGVTVPGQGQMVLTLPCPSTRRGTVRPGRIHLSCTYPLGLFRAWSLPYPPLEALCYPTPWQLPLPPAQTSPEPGELGSQAGYDDFSGLHRRQPADPLQHVAWKALARSGDDEGLLVKRFTGGGRTRLWLDWAATRRMPARVESAENPTEVGFSAKAPPSPRALFEAAELSPEALDLELRLCILAGWVLTAEATGVDYGLRLPGWQRPPEHGPAHQRACLEALARFDLDA